MKELRKYSSKRIDILEMQKYLSIDNYEELVKVVEELESKGVVSPVKSSRINGKRPPLYNKYNILQEKKDYSEYEDELKHRLNYQLSNEYYLRHLEQYLEDRANILKLSNFLNNKIKLLDIPVSENERSFQIWHREKFLKAEGGKRILSNLGIPMERLNIYPTTEPLSYFSIHKNTPQKVLILENKDTYYTLRQYLLKGGRDIFGTEIATVIYGRGKDIWKTFNDFTVCIEPYLLDEKNEILYLGDLDYEGILIYEQLYENFKGSFNIHPFVEAYSYMIDKAYAEDMDLPFSKEGQNKNLKGIFLKSFTDNYKKKIMDILYSGQYIPQEIISFSDLSQEAGDEA